jgi:hypothetical protein
MFCLYVVAETRDGYKNGRVVPTLVYKGQEIKNNQGLNKAFVGTGFVLCKFSNRNLEK